MVKKRLHTPEGVKDFKPEEFAYKRAIEKITETVFISGGYKRVNTPTLEFEEVFTDIGSVSTDEKYKFLSREGDLLVLRSDMTPAICRMAATAYEDDAFPLRFYYVENMFRYNEKNQGKQREMSQAGIELLGVKGIEGDIEVLMLALTSLKNLGIEDFKIDIGHAEFIDGALDEAGASEADSRRIKEAILDKDYITVSEIISKLDIKKEIKSFLENLPLCLGGEEVLEKAEDIFKNKKSRNAIKYMKELYKTLKGIGYEKYICFDLGIVAQLEYYTGIIFRGYSLGTGYSILSGGRYDRLSASFDKDFSAVGFAMKINELMPVLKNSGIKFKSKKADTLLVYTENGKFKALSTVIKLRKNGMNIENFYGNIDEAIEYAKNRGFGGILYFTGGENVKIYNISEDESAVVSISELTGEEE